MNILATLLIISCPESPIQYNYLKVIVIEKCEVDYYQITVNGESVKSGQELTIPILSNKIEIRIYGFGENGPIYESDDINLNNDDYNMEFELYFFLRRKTCYY